MSMVLIPEQYLLSPNLPKPVALWRVPYDQWLRKRKLKSSLQMFLHNMQIPPQSGQLQDYNTFLGHP